MESIFSLSTANCLLSIFSQWASPKHDIATSCYIITIFLLHDDKTMTKFLLQYEGKSTPRHLVRNNYYIKIFPEQEIPATQGKIHIAKKSLDNLLFLCQETFKK